MTIPERFTLATQISAGVRRSPLDPVGRGEEGLRVRNPITRCDKTLQGLPFRAAETVGHRPTCHCWDCSDQAIRPGRLTDDEDMRYLASTDIQ